MDKVSINKSMKLSEHFSLGELTKTSYHTDDGNIPSHAYLRDGAFDISKEPSPRYRIKIELQEAEVERLHRLSDEEEGKTLVMRRAGKNLDTNTLKVTLEKMLSNGDIPSGKRDGYVWYAVWLFFKKNKLLKEDSQGAFHRLMKSWFPGTDYGNDDKMRIYNSEYLEKYNWQIWKYEEFKKTSKIKTSERGFNAIKKLYEELERTINITDLWVGLY